MELLDTLALDRSRTARRATNQRFIWMLYGLLVACYSALFWILGQAFGRHVKTSSSLWIAMLIAVATISILVMLVLVWFHERTGISLSFGHILITGIGGRRQHFLRYVASTIIGLVAGGALPMLGFLWGRHNAQWWIEFIWMLVCWLTIYVSFQWRTEEWSRISSGTDQHQHSLSVGAHDQR